MASLRCGDQRGFAVQAAIVLTTLIAVALAVAAVIYTRGGEVVDDLERQNMINQPEASEISVEWECTYWEYTWNSFPSPGTCTP